MNVDLKSAVQYGNPVKLKMRDGSVYDLDPVSFDGETIKGIASGVDVVKLPVDMIVDSQLADRKPSNHKMARTVHGILVTCNKKCAIEEFEIGKMYEIEANAAGYDEIMETGEYRVVRFDGRVSGIRPSSQDEDLKYVTFEIPAYEREVKHFKDSQITLSSYEISDAKEIDKEFDEAKFSDGFREALISLPTEDLAELHKMLFSVYLNEPNHKSVNSLFGIMQVVFEILNDKVVYDGVDFGFRTSDVLKNIDISLLKPLVRLAHNESLNSDCQGWSKLAISLSKELLRRKVAIV